MPWKLNTKYAKTKRSQRFHATPDPARAERYPIQREPRVDVLQRDDGRFAWACRCGFEATDASERKVKGYAREHLQMCRMPTR